MSIRNKRFALVSAIVFVAVILAILTVGFLPAPIEVSASTTEEISIAHITDLHIFIPEFANSLSSAYMQTYNTDTKLLEESQAAVEATLDKIYEEAPMYMVVTGDLTSNGEKAGHERLAELFTDLTSRMRNRTDMDRSGFQIYVTPGNHDMYNDRASSYMPTQEELDACASEEAKQSLLSNYRRYVPTVSLADFADIYADFGYGPNTLGNIEYFYDSNYFYDVSSGPFDLALATKEDISAWKDANKDYSLLAAKARYGALSYIVRNGNMTLVSFDSTLRTFVGKEKHNAIYSYLPLSQRPDTMGWEEATGGFVNNAMLSWACSSLASDNAAGKSIFAISHHNFLPHFDMEDEILKDFTLYQWEYIVQNLANTGVRYAFSGHQHSNDIANYITQSGNVFYDFETGSPISYSAPARFVTVTRNTNGTAYYEDVKTSVYGINASFNYTVPKYNPETGLIEQQTKSVTNLLNLLDEKQTELLDTIVQGFISDGLFGTLKGAVDGLNGLLGMDDALYNIVIKVIDDLADLDMIKPTISSDNKTYSFGTQTTAGYNIIDLVQDMVFWFLAQDATFGRAEEPFDFYDLVEEVYKGSLAGANGPTLTANLQFVKDAADRGELTTFLFNTVLDFLLPQLEIIVNAPIRSDLTAPVLASGTGFDIAQQIADGKTNPDMDTLGKTLYTAVLSVIKNNLEYDTLFNLICSVPNAVDNILGNAAIASTIESFGAQSVVDTVVGYMDYLVNLKAAGSLTKFVQDELISKYLTSSLYVNLGIYVGQILEAFATDSTPDGASFNNNSGFNVTNEEDFNVCISNETYGGYAYAKGGDFADGTLDITPTIENGMLPSMLTVSFGENAASEKNFKWFTKIEKNVLTLNTVPQSNIKYWTTGNTPTVLSATSVNVEKEVPLIDLGIMYLTYELQTYNQHTVSLTGLTPSSTYYYQVGSDAYGWSGTYTFNTEGSGSFSVLGITDIQGSVQKNYQDSFSSMKIALETAGSPAFILSCGDNVDKGTSVSQWEWLLNDLRDVFGNYSFVSAVGNHEDSDFAVSSQISLPEGEGINVSESGYYYSFNYSNTHFVVLNTNDLSSDKNLSEAQTEWLTADLSANDKKWTIVLLHKGPYTAGSHAFDADVIALRAQLTPLFIDGGVDLVLQGHDHTYSVSKKIGRDGLESADGITYINLGTMGDKFYNYIYHEDVLLKNRTSVSNALSGYLTEENKLELTETPVFMNLKISDSAINVVTYTIVNGEAYEVDNILIGSAPREKDWAILIFSALCVIVLVIIIAIIVTIVSKKKKGKKGGSPLSPAPAPQNQNTSKSKPAPVKREERHTSEVAKERVLERIKEPEKAPIRPRIERPSVAGRASSNGQMPSKKERPFI